MELTKWMELNELEHQQLDDYDVFIDQSKFAGCKKPRDFRLIRVHTIFKTGRSENLERRPHRSNTQTENNVQEDNFSLIKIISLRALV